MLGFWLDWIPTDPGTYILTITIALLVNALLLRFVIKRLGKPGVRKLDHYIYTRLENLQMYFNRLLG